MKLFSKIWKNIENLFEILKNIENSSLGVTCTAKNKCRFRHTDLCDKCKNNTGIGYDENFFESKDIPYKI